MFNPQKEAHINRLIHRVEWSRRRLESFRNHQLDAMKQFAGMHYGENGASDKVPVNILELAVTVYLSQLAAANPGVSVNAKHYENMQTAFVLEQLINHDIRQMDLQHALSDAVLNAMFSIGIIKVGVCSSTSHAMQGMEFEYGQLYADSISLEDWVHDMAVSKFNQCTFMGNKYEVPIEIARNDETFDPKVRKKLTPNEFRGTTDDLGIEGFGSVTVSSGDSDDEDQKTVLWDFWIPETRQIVTIADGMTTPLAVREMDIPRYGPYHILGFGEVPSNTMPRSVSQGIMDLHDLANRLYRKLARQAERQKTVGMYRDGSSDDADRILRSQDGEYIRVQDPNSTREAMFGGIDQSNLAFTLQTKDLAYQLAGNLDLLGGLSQQADTLGQERLLNNAANKRMATMQQRVLIFVSEVVRDFAYYRMNDPFLSEDVKYQIPGTEIESTMTITADKIRGDALDYNYDIDPTSLSIKSPSERLQTIMSVWNTFIGPYLPLFMQQGAMPNLELLMDQIARLSGEDSIRSLMVFQQSQPPEAKPLQGSLASVRPPKNNGSAFGGDSASPNISRAGRDQQTSMMALSGGAKQRQTQGRN